MYETLIYTLLTLNKVINKVNTYPDMRYLAILSKKSFSFIFVGQILALISHFIISQKIWRIEFLRKRQKVESNGDL